MIENNVYSTFSIPCHDIANVVEFAPYEWCSTLLAVGTNSRVSIYQCVFDQEKEEPDGEEFEWRSIFDFQNGFRVTSISWCPETTFMTREKEDFIRFAIGGSDKKIKIVSANLKGDNTCQICEGHTDFINSIAYIPDTAGELVSTGDDNTLRLWNKEGEQQGCFQLSAPGMSVCVHEREPGKVIVAQKNGIIKIFSLALQRQIMSLDCCQAPLMSADWSYMNEDFVVAACGTEWLIFQMSRSSQPLERRQAHTEGCKHVKWARNQQTLLATSGRPGRQIKVFSTRHHQMPLSTTLQVAYGMSWHQIIPALAIGGDKQVHVYLLQTARSQPS
ncbi:nucleoporin Nup37-like [Mytilus trossulus]|uniref:nucleoporin Nup37-like n=1 Tax=Mytilus trossulus TaxID=6551 RepID=UPI0030050B08